jgi:cellulose 1,4-beta-cellobiosidase
MYADDHKANLNGTYGACCNEMDIWEANRAANAYTPHPCNANQTFACQGVECGGSQESRYLGVCDKDGCDYNPYRNGNKAFYSPGANYTVDTSKTFTVITQFITTDNTSTGDLKEIRRLYVQNGKVIQNSKVNVPGLDPVDTMTDAYCAATKKVFGGTDHFTQLGALKKMGEAIGRGMVLALSIWDDGGSYMGWLDQDPYPADGDSTKPGVGRGPCPVTGGRPDVLIKEFPDAKVVFSNIRSGDIGSTYVSQNGTDARRRVRMY